MKSKYLAADSQTQLCTQNYIKFGPAVSEETVHKLCATRILHISGYQYYYKRPILPLQLDWVTQYPIVRVLVKILMT